MPWGKVNEKGIVLSSLGTPRSCAPPPRRIGPKRARGSSPRACSWRRRPVDPVELLRVLAAGYVHSAADRSSRHIRFRAKARVHLRPTAPDTTQQSPEYGLLLPERSHDCSRHRLLMHGLSSFRSSKYYGEVRRKDSQMRFSHPSTPKIKRITPTTTSNSGRNCRALSIICSLSRCGPPW